MATFVIGLADVILYTAFVSEVLCSEYIICLDYFRSYRIEFLKRKIRKAVPNTGTNLLMLFGVMLNQSQVILQLNLTDFKIPFLVLEESSFYLSQSLIQSQVSQPWGGKCFGGGLSDQILAPLVFVTSWRIRERKG